MAKKLVDYGEWLMGLFFRDKYDHHAVTLETIAAVPGVVGAGKIEAATQNPLASSLASCLTLPFPRSILSL